MLKNDAKKLPSLRAP